MASPSVSTPSTSASGPPWASVCEAHGTASSASTAQKASPLAAATHRAIASLQSDEDAHGVAPSTATRHTSSLAHEGVTHVASRSSAAPNDAQISPLAQSAARVHAHSSHSGAHPALATTTQ